MGVKFFGQFLVDRGEFDAAQMREAIQLMKRTNRTLGELAVEAGYATEEDTRRINAAQRYVDRPFGGLAVELGVLTLAQLDELLRRQRETYLPIGEALVRLGYLDEARLGVLLDEYKADEASHDVGRVGLPASLADHPLAEAVVDLLPKLCLRMGRVLVKLAPWDDPPPASHLPFVVTAKVRGGAGLAISLAVDRHLGEQIAAATLRREGPLDDDRIYEGLGEFLGTLAGSAMKVLESRGVPSELAPLDYDPPEPGPSFQLASPHTQGMLVLRPL